MRIHILSAPPTPQQIQEMLEPQVTSTKLAVDVSRRIVAGGGEMRADCESALLEAGSSPDDIWGAWVPSAPEVRFESFINIRPLLGNRSMMVQDPGLRSQIESVVRVVFEK